MSRSPYAVSYTHLSYKRDESSPDGILIIEHGLRVWEKENHPDDVDNQVERGKGEENDLGRAP